MINPLGAVVGIITLLIVVGGLLYIFYARTNAVEKTGYGSLVMLALISLMIPIFWIVETNNEASAKTAQITSAVQSGLMLYAQYCVDQCYTIQGGKISSAKYNGYPIDQLNQLSDDQLTRLISAGVYNPSVPTPTSANLVPTSEQYGGPLDSNDVNYLFYFIRSADPGYMAKQGYFGPSGFTQLAAYLQTNNPSAYQTASAPPPNQFGNPVDMTKQKTITINIENSKSGQSCQPACYTPVNVKVKVGTVITWVNKSSTPHTVTAIKGMTLTSPTQAPQIFDSKVASPLNTGGTFTYTVTPAAYSFNSDHTVFYYCQIHPTTMFAELVIVQ